MNKSSMFRLMIIIYNLLFTTLVLANDSLLKYINLDDESRFKGYLLDSTIQDVTHFGTKYYKDFSKEFGYFEKQEMDFIPRYILQTNNAGDSIFYNTYKTDKGNHNYIIECFSLNDYKTWIMSSPERFKVYNNKDKRWYIYNIYNFHTNIFYGITYDTQYSDVLYLSEESGGYKDEYSFRGILFFLMLSFSLYVIFPSSGCFVVSIFVIISLILSIFLSPFIQVQLYFPLSLILLTALLFLFPKYKGNIRFINQLLLGLIIIGYFSVLQFCKTRDIAQFNDGTEISLEFKRGTGLLKRFVIKDILSNMSPVSIENEDNNYTIYVSKYELSHGQYDVLNNDVISYLSYFIQKKPKNWYSYRHAQIFTKMLEECTGIKFDFLTYPEWQIISGSGKHAPIENEFHNVFQGPINKYGLVNFSSNASEYTSSYSPTYHIGKSTDTLITSYDWIYVAGSPYITKDSVDYAIVNKNRISGSPAVRLVYRPNNIGLSSFDIIGHRCSNSSNYLPNKIKLQSIDNQKIEDIDRYETFEELLIVCRYKDCEITAINLDNNHIVNFIKPKGTELYDFEPHFSFSY